MKADTVSGYLSGTVRGQGGGHRGGVTPCPLSGCPPVIRISVRGRMKYSDAKPPLR